MDLYVAADQRSCSVLFTLPVVSGRRATIDSGHFPTWPPCGNFRPWLVVGEVNGRGHSVMGGHDRAGWGGGGLVVAGRRRMREYDNDARELT